VKLPISGLGGLSSRGDVSPEIDGGVSSRGSGMMTGFVRGVSLYRRVTSIGRRRSLLVALALNRAVSLACGVSFVRGVSFARGVSFVRGVSLEFRRGLSLSFGNTGKLGLSTELGLGVGLLRIIPGRMPGIWRVGGVARLVAEVPKAGKVGESTEGGEDGEGWEKEI